jgi:hypothetical protein
MGYICLKGERVVRWLMIPVTWVLMMLAFDASAKLPSAGDVRDMPLFFPRRIRLTE